MEYVPFAFVDALCATLKKKDLKILQEIGEPWTSTVTTHYSRRREVKVLLDVNPEGTEVEIGVLEYGHSTYGKVASLSRNDRIRLIWMGYPFIRLPEQMPMERFRSKVLPALTSLADDYEFRIYIRRYPQHLTDSLFSCLHGSALEIRTGYFGQKSTEFIEQQRRTGRLEHLELYGNKWPDRMKAIVKLFLKSPNFVSLDLGGNLKVDRDMLICIVQRFLKGDLRKGALLQGKPSKEMKALHRALLFGGDLPLLDRLLDQRAKIIREINTDMAGICWTRPDSERLHAWISPCNFVEVYRL
uniref:F-box domain-containing protein n=1 Tax=Steinernema glaseri TaxID=37863 RepID=A0A1I7XW08_9BILA